MTILLVSIGQFAELCALLIRDSKKDAIGQCGRRAPESKVPVRRAGHRTSDVRDHGGAVV
jgi:hypothetical protein